MPQPTINREQIRNKLTSLRELLRDSADELRETMPKITRENLTVEEWFTFRTIAHTVEYAAVNTANLSQALTEMPEAMPLDIEALSA